MRSTFSSPVGDDRPHIIEQDGDIVFIRVGKVEICARLRRDASDVYLERLSLDGASANAIGLRVLRRWAAAFLQDQGGTRLIITGTTRASGANPGRLPKSLTFYVR